MIMLWRQIDRYPRLNVNKLVNPYDNNGELMLQIVMKLYPHKINHKYVEEMQYKYGLRMQSNMGYTQKYPYQMNETMHDQLQSQFQQQMSVYQNQPNATHHQLNAPVPQQGVMPPQGQMVHHPQMQNMNPNIPTQGGAPQQPQNIPSAQNQQQTPQNLNNQNSSQTAQNQPTQKPEAPKQVHQTL